MITKRIIPCLDVKDGRVVKGVNFAGLQDVSSPVELAEYYTRSGADELVFYDITASAEGRGLFPDILRRTASRVFIPLTVGGGINTLEDFDRVLKCGADKVSVNSGAIRNPDLIRQAALRYGSQCVVLSADVKRVDGQFRVFGRHCLRRRGAGGGLCPALPDPARGGRGPGGLGVPFWRDCHSPPEGPAAAGGDFGAIRLGGTTMIDMEKLKFDEKGLIPAIVVDGTSGQVLTLAYMNRESLAISIREERTCFWSRSRQELWRKGETSGAVQHIIDITADCDCDALVIRVNKEGPACHTGAESCFHNLLFESRENAAFSLQGLMELLQGRKDQPQEGSYTSYLFDKGLDKILKKVGEEATEVIIAGKAEDRKETVYEIADLAYHVMVLMLQLGISLEDVGRELASRHVIDKKVKQEKMT